MIKIIIIITKIEGKVNKREHGGNVRDHSALIETSKSIINQARFTRRGLR